MHAKVQKLGNEYVVTLPMQVVEDLQLSEGMSIDVRLIPSEPGRPALQIKRLSDEEVAALFDRIEPLHRNTFIELAK